MRENIVVPLRVLVQLLQLIHEHGSSSNNVVLCRSLTNTANRECRSRYIGIACYHQASIKDPHDTKPEDGWKATQHTGSDTGAVQNNVKNVQVGGLKT